MDTKKTIDFKFAKNWKIFIAWYDAYRVKNKSAPEWEYQAKKIKQCFESSNVGIINWKLLWSDLSAWCRITMEKNEVILWSEQRRQIETLMLGQLSELNKEQFILVFLHKGQPEISMEKTTYWDALRIKASLEGDANGSGGNEDMDKISIINLKKLIQ